MPRGGRRSETPETVMSRDSCVTRARGGADRGRYVYTRQPTQLHLKLPLVRTATGYPKSIQNRILASRVARRSHGASPTQSCMTRPRWASQFHACVPYEAYTRYEATFLAAATHVHQFTSKPRCGRPTGYPKSRLLTSSRPPTTRARARHPQLKLCYSRLCYATLCYAML